MNLRHISEENARARVKSKSKSLPTRLKHGTSTTHKPLSLAHQIVDDLRKHDELTPSPRKFHFWPQAFPPDFSDPPLMQQPPRGGGGQPTPGTWFSGAHTSKFFLLASVASYVLVQNRKNGPMLQFDSLAMTQREGASGFYRYGTSKLCFLSSGELIVGTSLLFHFLRKYEREMGSRKFICFWLIQYPLSIAQEFMWLQALSTRNIVLDRPSPTRWQYAGPYALVGSLFTLFHIYAPRIYPRFVSVLGFHFSEKSFYYVWFLYFAASGGWSTLVPTSTGIVASLIYLNTPFLSKLIVPNFIVRMFRPIVERLGFADDPPTAPPVVPPRPQQQRRPNRPAEAPVAIPVPEPDAAAVEQLAGMGFPRQQVMEALRQSHNNVEHAANRLLGGS